MNNNGLKKGVQRLFGIKEKIHYIDQKGITNELYTSYKIPKFIKSLEDKNYNFDYLQFPEEKRLEKYISIVHNFFIASRTGGHNEFYFTEKQIRIAAELLDCIPLSLNEFKSNEYFFWHYINSRHYQTDMLVTYFIYKYFYDLE